MVSEKVVVRLRFSDAKVSATFHFKNLGGPTTVLMGFPENGSRSTPSLHDFKSEVDGPYASVKRIYLSHDSEDHKAVWIKKVSFARGQSRTVRVSYRSDNSFLDTGSNWQVYVLTTGATWAGNIEKCQLELDGSALRNRYGFVPLLKRKANGLYKVSSGPQAQLLQRRWTEIKSNVFATTLTNIKPDFDLEAEILGGFWRFKINGTSVPLGYAINWAEPVWPRLVQGNVLVPTGDGGLGCIFGDEDPKKNDEAHGHFSYWSNPILPARPVDSPRTKKIMSFALRDGKIVNVPYKNVWLHEGLENQHVDMLDLADAVKALGGNYRFDKQSGYVLIEFPRVLTGHPKRNPILLSRRMGRAIL